MTEATSRSRSAVAAHPVTSAAITILVAAAIFFSLWAPLYSRLTPKLGDFPFFYWYLLVYMPATSLALWLAALLQKRLTVPGAAAAGSPVAASESGSEDVQ